MGEATCPTRKAPTWGRRGSSRGPRPFWATAPRWPLFGAGCPPHLFPVEGGFAHLHGLSPRPPPRREARLPALNWRVYSGAVLAGGASRRFGEDKALFLYRGKPLLLWVLESLGGAAERFLVANRPYEGFGVPVYPDLLPGADSLSGLHSALVHARFPWVAVAATDLPFLTRAYWDFLYEKALASPHPVVAVHGPEAVSYTHLTLPTNREV